jgi:preprotein translocase subunit SecG
MSGITKNTLANNSPQENNNLIDDFENVNELNPLTRSENRYMHPNSNEIESSAGNFAANNSSAAANNKQLDLALIVNNNKKRQGANSTSNELQNLQTNDSLSTLSDKKKKIIVRIVTIFSVVFFLLCFAMIAFTLRMSEKIDAQSKIIKIGYVFFVVRYMFYKISKNILSN